MNYVYLKDYPDVLTPIQIKKILNVGKNRIYSMLKSGEINSIKIGNQYRIPKQNLNIYLNKK